MYLTCVVIGTLCLSFCRQLALNFVVSAAYAILHALLLFVHVVTMFVAVNSSDQVRVAADNTLHGYVFGLYA